MCVCLMVEYIYIESGLGTGTYVDGSIYHRPALNHADLHVLIVEGSSCGSDDGNGAADKDDEGPAKLPAYRPAISRLSQCGTAA